MAGLLGDSSGMTFDTRSKMLELPTLVLNNSLLVSEIRRQHTSNMVSSSSGVPSEILSVMGVRCWAREVGAGEARANEAGADEVSTDEIGVDEVEFSF